MLEINSSDNDLPPDKAQSIRYDIGAMYVY